MSKVAVNVRLANIKDRPFVLDSWLKSYQTGSEWARMVAKRFYFQDQSAILDAILARPTVAIMMAVSADAEALGIGFICYEIRPNLDRPIIHYIFVKEPWRQGGVATTLIKAAGIDPTRVYFSHHTKDRFDLDKNSPSYGKVRFRGCDVLLKKWPCEKICRDQHDPHNAAKFSTTEGNLYRPIFMFM